MKLIIGLGNPGERYKKNRHNLGFLTLDWLSTNLGNFGKWKSDAQAQALVCEGKIANEKIILAKPQTFMNLSGQTANTLISFYKIDPGNLWLIHDDFDLPLGMLRISKNASCAGHKGVKSIIDALGEKNFFRFRLGIRPTGKEFGLIGFKKKISAEKFVLKNFSRAEKPIVQKAIKKAADSLETALKRGAEQAMSEFN